MHFFAFLLVVVIIKCLYFVICFMKKIISLFILLSTLLLPSFSIIYAQGSPWWDTPWWTSPKKETGWNFENGPVRLLEEINYNANKKKSEEVQNTPRNHVTSKAWCEDLWVNSTFTLTKTLCYLKNNSGDYLQYFMYICLTVATIIIIRNWFLLVTSSDRWKQMWTFKKNMKNLIIWIILITCFYFILDVFVSMVNFATK